MRRQAAWWEVDSPGGDPLRSHFRPLNPCRRNIGFTVVMLMWAIAAAPTGASEPPVRTTDGLQALYTFDRLENGVIFDRSQVGDQVQLRIDKPQGVRFRNGRMVVTSSVTIASDGPARKIVAALKRTNVPRPGPPTSRPSVFGHREAHWSIRVRVSANSQLII